MINKVDRKDFKDIKAAAAITYLIRNMNLEAYRLDVGRQLHEELGQATLNGDWVEISFADIQTVSSSEAKRYAENTLSGIRNASRDHGGEIFGIIGLHGLNRMAWYGKYSKFEFKNPSNASDIEEGKYSGNYVEFDSNRQVLSIRKDVICTDFIEHHLWHSDEPVTVIDTFAALAGDKTEAVQLKTLFSELVDASKPLNPSDILDIDVTRKYRKRLKKATKDFTSALKASACGETLSDECLERAVKRVTGLNKFSL